MDRVVVISLARREDRRYAFQLPDDWPWPDPIWFSAIDGLALDLPPAWAGAGAGAYGCALSHLAVLQQALAEGIHSLLILEDDAVFCPDFGDRLREFTSKVPDDWALLMLGGQHAYGRPPEPVVQCIDTQRTHAYVVRGPAIQLMADAWYRAVGHIDHSLSIIQAQIPTYAPRPFLVGQRAGLSDVDGRVSPERFWN